MGEGGGGGERASSAPAPPIHCSVGFEVLDVSAGSVRQCFICIRCARQQLPPPIYIPSTYIQTRRMRPSYPWSPIFSVPPHRWASDLPDACSSCQGKSQALGLLSQTPSLPQLLEAHILSGVFGCALLTRIQTPHPCPAGPVRDTLPRKGPQEESGHERKSSSYSFSPI